MVGSKLRFRVLCSLLAVCPLVSAMGAAPVLARVDVTAVGATFSSLQAGGAPDFGLTIDLSSNPASDDPKDLVITLPQGLVANPLAAQRCPIDAFNADACPAASRVGTTSVVAQIEAPLGPQVTASGDVYNLVPPAGEPARLGVVVRPPLASPQRYQVAVRLRGDRGFVIENSMSGLERTAGGLPIRIQRIQLNLTGQVAGKPFLRMPTACRRAEIAVAVRSWDEPQVTTSRATAFTPSGCERLPFRPRLSGVMGAPGATKLRSHVPVTASVISDPSDAAVAATTVTLPLALGVDLGSLQKLCQPDQFAADACPADTRVGRARLASPLLEQPLELPVYIVQRPGELPALGFRLFGGAILGRTRLGGAVTNVFEGLPDLPLSRFDLTVDGGPRGLLQAVSDLCTPRTRRDAQATFAAFTGVDVTVATPFAVDGCPAGAGAPVARTRYRIVEGLAVSRLGRAVLTLRVSASRPLGRATLALPREVAPLRGSRPIVRVDGRRLGRRALVLRGRKLELRITRPGRTIEVRWAGLRASRALAGAVARGRRAPLTVRLAVVEASGERRAFTLRVRARKL
ncbi:hypothetical protein SAMN02745716_1166 [Thermoleophilum album]|uniref:Uncharacterized protein n=2 Tax=Thermoleophilum album TaxID=29539 RepID=A0A1H6FS15_THEAL|nr:hypothetical protein SAMN02745716_1166 [Thermoleophilum album]